MIIKLDLNNTGKIEKLIRAILLGVLIIMIVFVATVFSYNRRSQVKFYSCQEAADAGRVNIPSSDPQWTARLDGNDPDDIGCNK